MYILGEGKKSNKGSTQYISSTTKNSNLLLKVQIGKNKSMNDIDFHYPISLRKFLDHAPNTQSIVSLLIKDSHPDFAFLSILLIKYEFKMMFMKLSKIPSGRKLLMKKCEP